MLGRKLITENIVVRFGWSIIICKVHGSSGELNGEVHFALCDYI